ncbi:MAG: tetratricopeptide repeat protein, partial [Spirochaetales bacterium]|nr:tetratricopeptide repeat protein [Spirochaetales bacterium]
FISKSQDKKKIQKAKKSLSILERELKNEKIFKEAFEDIKDGRERIGIKKIKNFLKTNDEVWNAWFLIGWGYRKIEDYIRAKEAFLKALSLQENFADIYNELSICSMELNNLEESKSYLDKAIELDPNNIKILSNLGILEMKKENIQSAKEYFKRILTIDNQDEIAKRYLNLIETK